MAGDLTPNGPDPGQSLLSPIAKAGGGYAEQGSFASTKAFLRHALQKSPRIKSQIQEILHRNNMSKQEKASSIARLFKKAPALKSIIEHKSKGKKSSRDSRKSGVPFPKKRKTGGVSFSRELHLQKNLLEGLPTEITSVVMRFLNSENTVTLRKTSMRLRFAVNSNWIKKSVLGSPLIFCRDVNLILFVKEAYVFAIALSRIGAQTERLKRDGENGVVANRRCILLIQNHISGRKRGTQPILQQDFQALYQVLYEWTFKIKEK